MVTRAPCAQNRRAQSPEPSRIELEADQEEHHHHPKLGELHDVAAFFSDQVETEGADDDTGQQIPQNRAQTHALGDRNRDHRRRHAPAAA